MSFAPAFFQGLQFSVSEGDGCLEAIVGALRNGVWARSASVLGLAGLLCWQSVGWGFLV